ncbi:MAG TPA: hypothetical protein VH188_02925 [Chthoniobacterales bacterium]|nr:hypothetical protein [Chthoniobacterales bacterium]
MTGMFSQPRTRALLGLVAITFFAAVNYGQTPSASTGIEGVITTGPVHGGPSRAGETDSAPMSDIAFEVTNDTGVVTSFKTGTDGSFRVSIPPGHYLIRRAGTTPKLGGCRQFTVDVSAGNFAKVHFECDSGIR